MSARETSTSSGIVTPGRAERARRIAFSIWACAPSALGETLIVRVGLITSGSGRSNVLRTSAVASRGVSQPTRMWPMLTPGAISGRFDGRVGGGGAGVVVDEAVVVEVVVVSVEVVSAPEARGEKTDADTKPSEAQATSEAAPAAKSFLLTPAV